MSPINIILLEEIKSISEGLMKCYVADGKACQFAGHLNHGHILFAYLNRLNVHQRIFGI